MNTLLTIGIFILILSNFFLIYIDRKNLKKVEELKEEVEEDISLYKRRPRKRYGEQQ